MRKRLNPRTRETEFLARLSPYCAERVIHVLTIAQNTVHAKHYQNESDLIMHALRTHEKHLQDDANLYNPFHNLD